MLSQLEKYGAPDVIVPVNADSVESAKKKITWLHEKFGFTRFCLSGLTKGHRSMGYPTREEYVTGAKMFAEIREWIKGQGLSVGWFCCLTVKSGRADSFTPIIKADGSAHPFANCPADEGFAEALASDIAAYADIARPDFIFLEDDFSVSAAAGCYCERHLSMLEEKVGRRLEREELVKILADTSAEALTVKRAFADVKRESLVALATKIQIAVEKSCPEIPIGLMQSGASERDGDMTEAVTKALAGERHTPFVRLHGTFYCGFKAKQLPAVMFNALYKTEHIPSDILCYHESDSYPHTRFYSSGKEMSAMLSAAYSLGMVGSIFFSMQSLDEPFEEPSLGKHFAREYARLRTICEIARDSAPFGVELSYDSYIGDVYESMCMNQFKECIGRFGIPFTTKEANVALWDGRYAKYADDVTVMRYLSRGLILDADAAKILCRRGFGKYLGVNVGDPLTKSNPKLVYDLGAKEVITEKFAAEGEGRKMWCGHAYCPAGGREWVLLTPTDESTEVVTEARDFRGNLLCPGMTYFENELGGKVCVISQSIEDNHSQSIYNYRRMALLQRIITLMSDEYPYVKGAPDVYLIATKPKSESDILASLTLINLCTDDNEDTVIYLPPTLCCATEFLTINKNGDIVPLDAEICQEGIKLTEPLRYCEPIYIILKGNRNENKV